MENDIQIKNQIIQEKSNGQITKNYDSDCTARLKLQRTFFWGWYLFLGLIDCASIIIGIIWKTSIIFALYRNSIASIMGFQKKPKTKTFKETLPESRRLAWFFGLCDRLVSSTIHGSVYFHPLFRSGGRGYRNTSSLVILTGHTERSRCSQFPLSHAKKVALSCLQTVHGPQEPITLRDGLLQSLFSREIGIGGLESYQRTFQWRIKDDPR